MKLSFGAPLALLFCVLETPSWAQTTPSVLGQGVATDTAIPSLMFFTLGSVLLIAIVSFALFLRKRSNRDAASRALLGKGLDTGRN
jgi:hypothetical protein